MAENIRRYQCSFTVKEEVHRNLKHLSTIDKIPMNQIISNLINKEIQERGLIVNVKESREDGSEA